MCGLNGVECCAFGNFFAVFVGAAFAKGVNCVVLMLNSRKKLRSGAAVMASIDKPSPESADITTWIWNFIRRPGSGQLHCWTQLKDNALRKKLNGTIEENMWLGLHADSINFPTTYSYFWQWKFWKYLNKPVFRFGVLMCNAVVQQVFHRINCNNCCRSYT